MQRLADQEQEQQDENDKTELSDDQPADDEEEEVENEDVVHPEEPVEDALDIEAPPQFIQPHDRL